MLNRYLLSLFVATLSISCLSAYDQDYQEFKDFQAYKEYQKTKDKKIFVEREKKTYLEQQRLEQQRLEQEENRCCQEQGRNSFEEYLEFLEYRRDLERENRYCKELEQARLCEISQIDPNKDRLENFRFSADWLYFKAVQDALPFVVNLEPGLARDQNSFFGGSLSEPKWKYKSGVRLACAMPVGLENWEVGASYSFVGNKASNSKNTISDPTRSLYTIMGSASLEISGDVLVNLASENWKLTFNTADITLESPIYINNSLKIRPIIGVQGSSIHQKTNVGYSNFVPLGAGATPPTKMQSKNDTWGIGPKFGLGLTLAMPYQVNFNFLACFASLFGQGKSKTTYSDFVMIRPLNDDGSGGGPEVPIDAASNTISYKATRMFSVIQLQGAIEKAWDFDCSSVSIAIGWEAQTWFRQQRLIYYGNVSNPSQGSDLTLQGPFARINMDF